jgi:hypothetical protein
MDGIGATPLDALPDDSANLDPDVNTVQQVLDEFRAREPGGADEYAGDDWQQEGPAQAPPQAAPAKRNLCDRLSILSRVVAEAKLPLLVALAYVMLDQPGFDSLFTRIIPRTLAPHGGVNLIGIALKAVLLALILYVLSKLL